MDQQTTAWAAAQASFQIEADALTQALTAEDETAFLDAVSLLARAPRIAASGCGHSGIACAHFAHLLCCIERPARFLSPAEAVHGGLGFLQAGDVLLLASRGGKTLELLPMAHIAREKGARVLTVTEDRTSPLAQAADVLLPLRITRETDRYNCQGTTSFVVLSALFDALQSALIEATGYQNEQFARIHPAGAVGERLASHRPNMV